MTVSCATVVRRVTVVIPVVVVRVPIICDVAVVLIIDLVSGSTVTLHYYKSLDLEIGDDLINPVTLDVSPNSHKAG